MKLIKLLLVSALLTMSASIFADPADVIRSNGCIFFDDNGTPWADSTADLQFVFTNNEDGNANVRCEGYLPEEAALPERALHFNFDNTGFVCLGGDESWKMTVTPSGRATFTCHTN